MDQVSLGGPRTYGDGAPRPRRPADDDGASARARTAILERAVARADAAGDHQVAIDGRRRLADDHCAAGRWDLAFPLLSACLRRHDRYADALGPAVDHDLCEWAAGLLPRLAEFPQVGLPQLDRALEDLARRWGSGPDGLRRLYQAQLTVGRVTGDWAIEERYFELWCALGGPRPGRAGDLELMIERLVLRGDPQSVAQGLELAEPALAGRVTLDRPMVGVTCLLALPLARAGALHLARALADTALRKVGQPEVGVEVAGHLIEFCALTGDLPNAVDLVGQRLWAFDGLHRPYGLLEFATAAAVLGRQVIDAGHAGHLLGAGPAAVPVEDLLRRAVATATDLAARFDARNGNDHHGTRVRARLAAAPLPVPVRRPLRAPARAGPPAAAPPATGPASTASTAPTAPAAPAASAAPGRSTTLEQPAPRIRAERSRIARWWRRHPQP